MNEEIKIYEPGNKHKNFAGVVKEMFYDLIASRNLGWQLFYRDKKGEYKQSVLGVFWAIITPLFTALVWIFLNASGAVAIEGTEIPYPVFVFLGTTFWAVFTESVGAPLNESNLTKAILSKVNFPKEAILISGFLKLLFNLVIKLILIVGLLILFGVTPGISFVWFIPIILLLSIFGYSMGLLITPIGMLYKDVGRAIPIALSLFMFLTPVVYPTTRIASINKFIGYNPLTPLINSARNTLTGMPLENPTYLLIIFVGSTLVLLFGWLFYRVSIPILVERM